ncbi:alpha-(1,6)-fucosyltransferase-like isoform X2 [Mya arenaria]|uniref:alpha-(1,6)-fucosyltransferase-like isoform X2 n=1 Tax=Mya arenaria TaxID=6604 RepID=UPI0022DEB027|nr:alpha-(1,6)-fucosyltransferase-like isoform X2 [Mya arenaria]
MSRMKIKQVLFAILGAVLIIIICKDQYINHQFDLVKLWLNAPKEKFIWTPTKLHSVQTEMMLHFASQARRHLVRFAQNINTLSLQNYVNSTLSDVSALLEVNENMFRSLEEKFSSTQIELKLQDVVHMSLSSAMIGNDRLPINTDSQRELVQSYREKGYYYFAEFVLKRCEGLKELSAKHFGIMQPLQHVCKKLHKLQTEIAKEMLEEQIRQQMCNEWNKQMSRELQSVVQHDLNQYQESPQCNSTRILTCLHELRTGFGSFIHRTHTCLVAALLSQRVLVIDAKNPSFIPNDFESYSNLKHRQQWPCSISNSKVIENELTKHAKGDGIPNPMEIPSHLANKLISFNKQPSAWWIGFMAEYMLGNDTLSRIVQDARQTMPFSSPVVGVHVRRTDKIGTEAKFHALEEYMNHVADWYSAYEAVNGRVERKVYLAADSVKVLDEAEQKYPEFVFLFNKTITQYSTDEKTRTSTKMALYGIVQDTVLLSRCDYLVCTMSSNVCRLAYELMHVHHGDAFNRVVSLDVDWFYSSIIYTAMMSHSYPVYREISFKVGDVIILDTDKQSQVQEKGFIIGKNRRTGQVGLVPKYKIVEVNVQRQYPHQ